MARRITTALLVLFLVIGGVLIALALPANAAPVAPAALACPTGWGSTPKTVAALSPALIDQVRAGRQACYDRLVFDVAGRAGGYRVEYVPVVLSEGRGAPLNVPGGARLSVNLHDPLAHVATISGYPWAVGGRVLSVAGFPTLRSVVFGGSFEGHTQFGVGTRARLPFRVFVLAGPGTHSRIVLDVANHW